MGINIAVYKLISKAPYKVEKIPLAEWDPVRQGYDKEFNFKTECSYSGSDPEPYNAFILKRPVNLDLELLEIQKTVPKEYKNRYIYLISLLRRNPNYYVHWSV